MDMEKSATALQMQWGTDIYDSVRLASTAKVAAVICFYFWENFVEMKAFTYYIQTKAYIVSIYLHIKMTPEKDCTQNNQKKKKQTWKQLETNHSQLWIHQRCNKNLNSFQTWLYLHNRKYYLIIEKKI